MPTGSTEHHGPHLTPAPAMSRLIARLRAGGVRAVIPNGVLGDPASASAEVGRELLRAASDKLVAMIDSWQRAG